MFSHFFIDKLFNSFVFGHKKIVVKLSSEVVFCYDLLRKRKPKVCCCSIYFLLSYAYLVDTEQYTGPFGDRLNKMSIYPSIIMVVVAY